jgi:hypothetical protein
MLTTPIVLLRRAIESNAGHLIEKTLELNRCVRDSLSIRESEIPPTRPGRRTCTEVVGLVDPLQLSNLFLSQINNFEVP